MNLLIENTPLNAEWIKPREEACETIYYLYSTIEQKFEKAYGKEFIKKNPNLIGILVQAAVEELNRSQIIPVLKDK